MSSPPIIRKYRFNFFLMNGITCYQYIYKILIYGSVIVNSIVKLIGQLIKETQEVRNNDVNKNRIQVTQEHITD